MTRILITRPLEDSKDLANILRQKNFDVMIEPMLTCTYLPAPQIEWKNYGGLILTSAHALHGVTGNPDTPVYGVGERTAAAARIAGFKNIHTIAATATDLIAALKQTQPGTPLLYLRARDVTTNLPVELPNHIITEKITYQMDAVPDFSPSLQQQLTSGSIDIALFFSRRSAKNFMDCAAKAQAFPAFARIKALCISQAVLQCLNAAVWAETHSADTPDQAGILKKLADMQGLGHDDWT